MIILRRFGPLFCSFKRVHIKVSFVSILLTVLLCKTLKANDKFCKSLTNIEGIERLECICVYRSRISVVCLFTVLFTFILCSSLHSLQVKSNDWKCDHQELFERELLVCYSRKRFFRKGSSEKGLILTPVRNLF